MPKGAVRKDRSFLVEGVLDDRRNESLGHHRRSRPHRRGPAAAHPEGADLARRGAHRDRRDRDGLPRRPVRDARGSAGRRSRDAHHAAVQAGQSRLPTRQHGRQRRGCGGRRRRIRGHGRAVLGRESAAAAGDGARRRRVGGELSQGWGLQAANLAVCLPGTRRRGSGGARGGATPDRACRSSPR